MIGATLFSGIGAPEVAMPHWHWVWCAENDRFAAAVLARRHPQSRNLGDVSRHDFVPRARSIARPDVVVFGSPCQPFSVAGNRLGLDDARGNMALVALAVVARLEPRWFVFENVPGLLSSAEGSDFGLFLRAVDDIGYSGAWAVLDAQWRGVAQRRERVFFVGYAGSWRGPAAVLFEHESLCGHHPPRREPGERIAPTIEARVDGGGAGWGTDFLADGGMVADVAWALQERDHKGVDSDTKDGHLIIAGATVRRLTPRECERLQGFPDDYTLIDYRGKPAPDARRYRVLGNAMAVPVVRLILTNIETVDAMKVAA